VLAYGYCAMKLHRVAADVDVDNLRSIALLERLGFQFEGVRRAANSRTAAPRSACLLEARHRSGAGVGVGRQGYP